MSAPAPEAHRFRWSLAFSALAAAVLLVGCQDLREVRDHIMGTQGASTPPPARAEAPQPIEPTRPNLRAPATAGPEVAALPPPGTPLPGPGGAVTALPAAPPGVAPPAPGGVTLVPPPGVLTMTRIALLVPLSGPDARLGEALLNAAQLALFTLASDSFELMPIDTRGTPEGAAAAARRAVGDGARLILGPLFSSSVAGAAPVTRAAGIQMVAFSNDRSVAGEGVFIMGFTPETQISRIMSFAARRGLHRVVGFVPEGAYGIRIAEALRQVSRNLGIDVKDIVTYAATTTDALTPIVRRVTDFDQRRAALLAQRKELEGKEDEASRRALKRLEGLDSIGDVDFDAVVLPEGTAVLRALAPLFPFYDVDPRKVRMLGTVQWDDPALATEPAVFGGWFPAPPPGPRHAFTEAYRRTYGEAPPTVASLAYDATAMAAVLSRSAGAVVAGATAVAAAPPPLGLNFTAATLTAPNGFAGVDGIFRLLPSGVAERGLAIKEVRSRSFAVIDPAPNTFEAAQP